jgi:hypothetical protein
VGVGCYAEEVRRLPSPDEPGRTMLPAR